LDGYPVGIWRILRDETSTDEYIMLPAGRIYDIDRQAVQSLAISVEFVENINLFKVLLHSGAETGEHGSTTSESNISNESSLTIDRALSD
jgi:hypothetical protein